MWQNCLAWSGRKDPFQSNKISANSNRFVPERCQHLVDLPYVETGFVNKVVESRINA